jgi:hypothetical protein
MSHQKRKLETLQRMHDRLDMQVKGAEAIRREYKGIDYHREERGALEWAIGELEAILHRRDVGASVRGHARATARRQVCVVCGATDGECDVIGHVRCSSRGGGNASGTFRCGLPATHDGDNHSALMPTGMRYRPEVKS